MRWLKVHRGIQLMEHAMQILERVIEVRVRKFMEIDNIIIVIIIIIIIIIIHLYLRTFTLDQQRKYVHIVS